MSNWMRKLVTIGIVLILIALIASQALLWETSYSNQKIACSTKNALIETIVDQDNILTMIQKNEENNEIRNNFLFKDIESLGDRMTSIRRGVYTNLYKVEENLSAKINVIADTLTEEMEHLDKTAESVLFTEEQLADIKKVFHLTEEKISNIKKELIENQNKLEKDIANTFLLIQDEEFQKFQKIEKVIENKENLIATSVEQNIESAVHIYCYSMQGSWQGSGVIVKENGLIVTAAHVIGNPGQPYTITLNSGKQYVTDKACYLENYDIGFIKIDVNEVLPTSSLGDFNDMRLGDPVYAIGSPWGYEHFNSVTKGVVSALKHSTLELPGWEVLWQTDCPGNPGNSGCPVYSDDGKIMGILVGAYTMAGGYDGIIYCVPSNIVMQYLDRVDALFNVVVDMGGIAF